MNSSYQLPLFSDYIVFVDESGVASLTSIDSQYPVFVLVFCIVEKNIYAEHIQPAIKKLKFEFFGHDLTVLHANDIRKPKGEFTFLLHPERRFYFMQRLSACIEEAEIHIIAHIIHKKSLIEKYRKPFDPYYIALRMCLEQTALFLKEHNQSGKLTHIIVESRGKKEDRELEMEFTRILDPNHNWGMADKFPLGETPFEMKCVEKKINSAGLQLADLAAHPIGRYAINPQQDNQAFAVIKHKIWKQLWHFP